MKHYWTIFSILLFTSVFAQEGTLTEFGDFNEFSDEQCAHTEIHERLMLESAQYKAEQEAQEIAIQNLVEQYKSGMLPKSGTIHTIPLVIHVIHKGEAVGTGTNISDAQIYSAVNALNQDYRKMAGTLGDGDGADIEVEFCLAQRDPDGNATTGINRINGCSVPLYCTEGITSGNGKGANELAVKNLSRWSNQQYYNIWIVSEIEDNGGGSGIQGYAYFPTASAVDGTVALYNAFGTEGALKSYTNRNKTITHEIGHAFALFHTFQGGSCSESNCTLQGDRICDTPPTTLNSNCNYPACGGTQLVENYMDYTNQNCKNMFTEGQKLRMRAAIENSRSSLINSNACEPVTTVFADAAITGISEPEGNFCTNMIQPVVSLKNAGTVNLNNVVIQYRTSGNWKSYNWTGLLGPNQTVNVSIPLFNGGWGQRTLEVQTTLPNGNTDPNTSNNYSSKDYNAVQDGHTLTLKIVKDVLGGQTTWLMRNSDNVIIASGGPYANFQSGTIETEVVCVDNGCYDFVIMDLMGDGICCANGNGSYTLKDENNNVLASGGDFGTQETTNFCFSSDGEAPVANFSANSTNICAGGSTTFTNLTSGDVDSYEWKFFGGTPFTVTGANPGTITYSTPGTYNVRLIATNQYGNNIELKSNYITVGTPQTWYADADNDGHGNPNSSVQSCTQPAGYVALGDDCNDNNPNDWNSCYDCLGVMNGNAVLDHCNVCDADPTNDCVQDCAGVWGGTAVLDHCNVCDSDPANDCVQDCAGVWGGTAVLDHCNVCDSDPANDCVQDCAGIWGGDAYYDDCGTCDSNPENDCVLCDGLGITLLSSSSPTCAGAENGEINIQITTSAGPYTLSWNNGMSGTSISGLSAGVYQATLSQGTCSAFLEVTLTAPGAILITVQDIIHDDCDAELTGAATISVSGGTQPYIITLNNAVLTDLSLNNLAADSYIIHVLDDAGCSASANFDIDQISCDTLNQTQIVESICTLENIGFYQVVNCEPVANALTYEWEARQFPDLDNAITFTTNGPSFSASEISAFVPGATYQIRVKGVNPLIPGAFGAYCELLFKIDTAKLIANDCGNLNLMSEDILTSTEIQGATDYEFRFENTLTLERLYYYSGGANSCVLSAVEDLELEVEYNVVVRGKYRNIWGGYGQNCVIKIMPFVETTALTDQWCENYSINSEADIIFLQPIENASVYEIRISNEAENFEVILQSNQPEFSATSFDGVNPETYYQVQARAMKGGVWTPWGKECTVAFKDPEILKLNMLIFPNPATYGRAIKLQTRGDWDRIIIEISDAQGHGLERMISDFKNMSPQEMNISNLRPGMYFLHVTHGKQTLSKKLLIQ